MVKGINHITLAVQNVERSFKFYHEIVGLKPLCKWNGGAYFVAGDIWFCLNLDKNVTARDDYTHIAFDVDKLEFDFIHERIVRHQVPLFKQNQSEGESLYFLDPDLHRLEIHIGTWQTRLESKRVDSGSWTDVEFYI